MPANCASVQGFQDAVGDDVVNSAYSNYFSVGELPEGMEVTQAGPLVCTINPTSRRQERNRVDGRPGLGNWSKALRDGGTGTGKRGSMGSSRDDTSWGMLDDRDIVREATHNVTIREYRSFATSVNRSRYETQGSQCE